MCVRHKLTLLARNAPDEDPWDYAPSVQYRCRKAPVLDLVEAMELKERDRRANADEVGGRGVRIDPLPRAEPWGAGRRTGGA